MEINQISQNFSVCGQISADDLETIVQGGYKAVVNFRPDLEGGDTQPSNASIEAKAKQLGLIYYYIPVIPGQIQPAQVAQLRTFLATSATPVLGFCRTGNRAAVMYQQALLT